MMPNRFVFVPRCVPITLFEQYLGLIPSKFPGRRIIVFESNPAFLKRYEAPVVALPYEGKRFLTEQMLSQVNGKVDWTACDAILISLSGNTTQGFEQLVQFADRAGTVPIYLITPDTSLTQVVRNRQSSAEGAVAEVAGTPKVSLDILTESALLGKIGGAVNRSYRYRDNSLYVFGWLDDAGRFAPSDLTVFADDEKSPVSAAIMRCGHPDPAVSMRGENPGIAIFVPPVKKTVSALRVCYPGGGETLFPIHPNTNNLESQLAEVASYAQFCRTRRELSASERERVDGLYGGLMEDINARFNDGIFIADELRLGKIPEDPSISLVIPIHKSYELVRHQFSHFAADAYLKKQEIICLLTSVSGGEEEIAQFKHLMRRIYELYAIPCRVLIANKNCSFSVACNLGAAASRGRYLMLLNSDVFPKSSGWLQRMAATMQSDPTIGIVGARLLYPDGSIQHVAMDWRREPACNNLLINVHPYKGMHPSLVPEQGVAEVAAVTGACMLVRLEEFLRLGMFDTGFIRGDCEDSDFCLRASAAGYRIVCDNQAVLYHLEGASYRPEVRRLLFHYNTERQEKRWGSIIARQAGESAGVTASL
jgi:GT2 family glycosyltransferase